MNLLKSLPPAAILVGIKASDKWALMEQMLDCILETFPAVCFEAFDREEIWRLLREREERQSTGIGEGFALPHARLNPFKHLAVCVAILEEDLEFDAIDGRPVRLVCMVLTNAEEPGLALKVMSKWSTLISDTERRKTLESARSAEEAHAFLRTLDLEIDVVVHAEDLMAKPRLTVLPETGIAEVTHRMMNHKVAATAVVDDAGHLVGEITADLLFQYGMPDFFKQLQSVSFVKNFNPLEKYFDHESEVKAGDLMSTEFAEVDRKGTLIEVIFLLTVKNHTMVYVTEEGKLIGVIYRLAVLNRALGF